MLKTQYYWQVVMNLILKELQKISIVILRNYYTNCFRNYYTN